MRDLSLKMAMPRAKTPLEVIVVGYVHPVYRLTLLTGPSAGMRR